MNHDLWLSTFVLEGREPRFRSFTKARHRYLTDRRSPGLAHSHGGVLLCYVSWHVVPVRNDCSEGNGRCEDKKRENKGDKDFHSEIRLSVYGP